MQRRKLILWLALMSVIAMSYIVACTLVKDDILALESMYRSAYIHNMMFMHSGIVPPPPPPIHYISPGFPRAQDLLLYSLMMSIFTLLILAASYQRPVITHKKQAIPDSEPLMVVEPSSSNMDPIQLQSIHRMLVLLSHQIRNPLAAAMGNMELLWLTVDENSRPADKLRRIQRGLDELHTIANFFLDQNITHAHQGEMLDLNFFLEQLLLEEKLLHTINFSSHVRPAPIFMEQMMMRYALLHLLRNTQRRSRAISMELKFIAHNYHLDIKARHSQNPPTTAEEPSTQALLSHKREEQICLTIARKVIEAHGGFVTLNHEATSHLYHMNITLPGHLKHSSLTTFLLSLNRPHTHSPKDHYHG